MMNDIKEIKWFMHSPDAGAVTCVCSLCGQVIVEGEIPIRLFDEDSGMEARFDSDCFALATRKPELPDIYQHYRLPYGLPLTWRDEVSGRLPKAVMAYITHMADRKQPPPNGEQLAMIIRHFTHFIFAPCWDESGFAKEMLQLRYEIQWVKTIAALNRWLEKAMRIGVDPL